MKQQILIFGDICPDNDYREMFDKNSNGAFSKEIAEEIKNSALVIANFECPATNNTVPLTKCGPALKAEPKDINLLKNMGFDVLSLANNHILDYGMQGVYETLKLCADSNICTVGAGENKTEAAKPLYCEVGSKTIGIISFAEAEFNLAGDTTPGANHFDPYNSFDLVTEMKKHCDYLIVLYHGGIEHYKNPSPLLQKKCRKFANSGADLVLCQHSHCIGTVEEINGSTILYGQGNSLFGYRQGNDAWNEGLMVSIEFGVKPVLRFRMLKATKDGIVFASKEESEERVKEMHKDSEKLNDLPWIENQWLLFSNKQEAMYFPMLFGRGRVFNKVNRILNNKLINKIYSRGKFMVTMNLLRCEAHHEVVQTILEEKIF